MENSVFFCFSGQDRLKYAQSLNFHLKNLGVAVWYDYEKIFLGDDGDYVNIDRGINQSRIFILFLSNNLFQSTGAKLELDAIKRKIDGSTQLILIPIFCDIKLEQIPHDYQWLLNYIYGEMFLDISTGTYDLSIDIYKRILKEKLYPMKYKELLDITFLKIDNFIDNVFTNYKEIDNNNINARVTLLYIMISYLTEKFDIQNTEIYYGCQCIFNKIKLNIQINLKEVICMEYSFLILVNQIISNFPDNADY